MSKLWSQTLHSSTILTGKNYLNHSLCTHLLHPYHLRHLCHCLHCWQGHRINPISAPVFGWIKIELFIMSGLPMTHGLRVFDVLEPKFTPSSLSCAWNWPPKLGSEGCVYNLKKLHYASAWKSGIGFPLVRHRYNSCDLGKNAMLSAQLYTLCFQALWSSGPENYNIVRSYEHYTLQSKSKRNIQNKILNFHSWLVKGWQLWTQSDTL